MRQRWQWYARPDRLTRPDELFGLRFCRVRGHSMAPTLDEGAYVLLRRHSTRRPPRPDDICVFRAAAGQTMIKRLVRETSPGSFEVRGDGPLSAPSIDLGPVATKDMVGRVVFTIRPPK